MLRPLIEIAKPSFKRALYSLGPLIAFHRLKNKHRLTVAMFHRVLSPADPRWHYCDPEYTIADTLLAECLTFFRKHYHVVSLADLLAPRPQLDHHPLLITFDDGWEDNARYALPVLRAAGLPAVIFVAGDAVDATQPDAFWEMWIIHAYRRGTLTAEQCRQLWQTSDDPTPAPAFTTLDDCRALIARLERLDLDALARVLDRWRPVLSGPDGDRQLLTEAELRRLAAEHVHVGGHGNSHNPLARVKDALGDLRRGRAVLAAKLGVAAADGPTAMSFPHGSYTTDVVRCARDVGYQLIFTSDPVLNDLTPGQPIPTVLGRLGIEQVLITDESGQFRPDLLALRLFRARSTVLNGQR